MNTIYRRLLYFIVTVIEVVFILLFSSITINALSDVLGLTFKGTGYDYHSLKIIMSLTLLFLILKNTIFDKLRYNRICTFIYAMIIFTLFVKIRYSPSYFFYFIFLWLILMLIVFLLLIFEKYFFQKTDKINPNNY